MRLAPPSRDSIPHRGLEQKRDPTGRRGEDAAPPVVLRAGGDELGGAASRRAPAALR